jgi:triosephosphate isomerase (TIM)
MRGKLVVGNWKMNGDLRRNDALLSGLREAWKAGAPREIAVCVPFPYLWQAQAALSGSAIRWGAQNMSEHPPGAHTGEVTAGMLAEFGCAYVIVGHSERRTMYGDTDESVAAKAGAALEAGLTPIVCVGESLAEREAGDGEAVVTRQLDAVVARIGGRIAETVVAYEPVWAIGTGRSATPEQAQAVHEVLRARLRRKHPAAGNVRLVYGGSVKAGNAKALFACADIDGGLIGGASLNIEEFLAIAGA